MTQISFFKTRQFIFALASLVFLCAFGWLLVCAVPTVYWGDSAEYASVACSAGVAHSPGYPLFALLARLAQGLPLPVGFAGNAGSAVCSAAACAALFLFLRSLFGRAFPAAVGALLMFGVPAFVFHSLFLEVYSLHLLLFFALLFCMTRLERGRDRRWFAVCLLILALGMTHHILMYFAFAAFLIYCVLRPGHEARAAAVPLLLLSAYAFMLMLKSHDVGRGMMLWYRASLISAAVLYIAYIAFLYFKRRAVFRASALTLALTFWIFAAFTFIFVYLPLTSARGPVADWWSPDTPRNFINLLFLKGYPPTFPNSAAELMRRLDFKDVLVQVPLIAAIAAAAGALVLLLRRTHLTLFLIMAGGMTFVGTLLVTHGKPEALRLPVYAILAIAAAAFVDWLTGLRAWRGAAWRKALAAPLYVLFALGAAGHLRDTDLRPLARSGSARELGAGIIDAMDPNSVLFIGVQTPGIMSYFQACESGLLESKHIAVLPVSFFSFNWKIEQLREQYPNIYFPDPPRKSDNENVFTSFGSDRIDYAMEIMGRNLERRAFYSDYYFLPEGLDYITIPQGAVYRILKSTESSIAESLLEQDRMPEWSALDRHDTLAAENIASVHNERGRVLMLLGRGRSDETTLKSALREFNRALKIDPSYADAYTNRGQCRLFLGDEEKGIRDMEYAVRLKKDTPDVYNVLAETLLQRHTVPATNRAIEMLMLSLALQPEQPRVYYHLGTAYTMMQDKNKAIRLFLKAVEIDPTYVEAFMALSRLYDASGDCGNSIGYLEESRDNLRGAPAPVAQGLKSLDLSSELAIRYYTCGFYKLFSDQIDDMTRTFPNDVNLLQSIGTVYREAGRTDQAIMLYHSAAGRFPEYSLFSMFDSLRFEDCGRSVPVVSGAVALAPRDVSMRLGFAGILALCNLPVDAYQQLNAAARLDPGNPGIAMARGELLKAHSKMFPNGRLDMDQAIAFYTKRVDDMPPAESAETLRSLSRLYALTGDCAKSVSLLERAAKRAPQNIAAQSELVRRIAACGLNDKMPDALKKLLTGFPFDYYFYLSAGAALRDIDRPDLALKLYEEVSRAVPGIRAADLYMTCDADSCGACTPALEKLTGLAPDDLSLRVRLAAVQCECGDKSACAHSLDIAKQKYPDYLWPSGLLDDPAKIK